MHWMISAAWAHGTAHDAAPAVAPAIAHAVESAVATPSLGEILFHLPPLHPLVVHFPIAFLFLAGTLGAWLLAAPLLARPSDRVAMVMRWMLYAGSVSALAATATGLYFESFVPHRHGGLIDPIMAWHERLGIGTTALAALLSLWAFRIRRRPPLAQRGLAVGAMLLLCAILCTSHLGGLLVHRFGIGTMEHGY